MKGNMRKGYTYTHYYQNGPGIPEYDLDAAELPYRDNIGNGMKTKKLG